MKQAKPDCLTPERSSSFLRGQMSAAEESELESHLDTCEYCRHRIEVDAADEDSWNEVSELLGTEALSRSRDNELETVPQASHEIRHVLQTLRPTDQPNMLGRIGGYEVSGVVGAGGMGVVLKAHDPSLDRIVAIKVMAPHLASSGSARTRFAREAKAAAAVLHPNVIAIHGVSNDHALPYLVMPYLRGVSLQKRIDHDGPLPVKDILRIGSQIAAGLSAAHQQGLVHRDIKPANIMLEDGMERVAITDFGLARAVDDASMTRSGVIAGTPQYMSPEQGRGETIDGRSDLFSLGSVLYAMCTGHSPFRAETSFGVLHRIGSENPRPIRETNPEIPPWLCRLIGRLHQKTADQRPQTAEEVERMMLDCLAHVEQPDKIRLPEELREPIPTRNLVAALCLSAIIIVAIAPLLLNESPQNQPLISPIKPAEVRSPPQASAFDTQPPDRDQSNPRIVNTEWLDPFSPSPEQIESHMAKLEIETRSFFATE